MTRKELNELPFGELIKENETIAFRSVFDFEGGHEELFPFLYGCRKANCDVTFENEGITVYADKKDQLQEVALSLYAWVAKEPKIATDYIRYLTEKHLTKR